MSFSVPLFSTSYLFLSIPLTYTLSMTSFAYAKHGNLGTVCEGHHIIFVFQTLDHNTWFNNSKICLSSLKNHFILLYSSITICWMCMPCLIIYSYVAECLFLSLAIEIMQQWTWDFKWYYVEFFGYRFMSWLVFVNKLWYVCTEGILACEVFKGSFESFFKDSRRAIWYFKLRLCEYSHWMLKNQL